MYISQLLYIGNGTSHKKQFRMGIYVQHQILFLNNVQRVEQSRCPPNFFLCYNITACRRQKHGWMGRRLFSGGKTTIISIISISYHISIKRLYGLLLGRKACGLMCLMTALLILYGQHSRADVLSFSFCLFFVLYSCFFCAV